METIFRIPNREIAMAAFESLRHEGKKDAALKLAGALLKHTYIPLGIGDTDWEIDTALRKYGGEPVTGYGIFPFQRRNRNGKREIRKIHERKRIARERPQGRSLHL